jgi:uncharacterized membrane protein YfcA
VEAVLAVAGLTTTELAVVLAVTAAGACIQGGIGFGLGLVAAPVLALVDHRLIPGPLIAAGVVLTVGVLHRERRDLRLGVVRWAMVGRVAGSAAGAGAVAAVSDNALGVLFGVLILAAVALSVAGWSVAPNAGSLLGAGALSGFMGTTVSVGGPPLALVYQHQPGPELRATMAAFMVFGALVSLGLLAAFGQFGGEEARLSLVLVPGVLAGFAASRLVARHLDRGWLRPAVLGFSAASAVALLVSSL